MVQSNILEISQDSGPSGQLDAENQCKGRIESGTWVQNSNKWADDDATCPQSVKTTGLEGNCAASFSLSFYSQFSFLFFFLFFNVYLFLRESVSRGGAERDTHTESKAGSSSELSAQSPTQGSNSQSVRSWPEPKSDTQPTEPPRHPNKTICSPVSVPLPTKYLFCPHFRLRTFH